MCMYNACVYGLCTCTCTCTCEVVLTVDVCFVQSHTKKKKTEILSGMIPVLGTCVYIVNFVHVHEEFYTCTIHAYIHVHVSVHVHYTCIYMF